MTNKDFYDNISHKPVTGNYEPITQWTQWPPYAPWGQGGVCPFCQRCPCCGRLINPWYTYKGDPYIRWTKTSEQVNTGEPVWLNNGRNNFVNKETGEPYCGCPNHADHGSS